MATGGLFWKLILTRLGKMAQSVIREYGVSVKSLIGLDTICENRMTFFIFPLNLFLTGLNIELLMCKLSQKMDAKK